MRIPVVATGVLVAVLALGCGDEGDNVDTSRESSTTETGQESKSNPVEAQVKVSGPEPKVRPPKGAPPKKLVVRDLKPGNGPEARPGDELTTQFVAIFVTGKQFESSWDAGSQPFSFQLGANESSPGWERGLRGMREGGRRELIVPPRISSRFGVQPGSGPEDTLVYVIDLLDVGGPDRSSEETTTRREPKLVPPAGPPSRNLVVRDLIEGRGPTAKRGDELTVEYIGIYYDGSHFTNSWKRDKPFEFTLGGNSSFVNPGWEKGVPGMRVGGRRELVIPPKLLYRGGAPPGTTPADTLVYVIDLVAVQQGDA